ncbi:MAG: DUF1566 domain-containing protein, partial [Rhodoferax sp.]|nr:DUF1566 domain-containing protein [Rhodoferax sp.]
YTTPATVVADNDALYTVEVRNSVGSTVTSSNARLTVAPVIPPAITEQPRDISVIKLQTASFSVEATGTAPLTYQWRKYGVNIAGATSSTYTTPATANRDNGMGYSVVVSNSAGTVISRAAILEIVPSAKPPSITVQPLPQSVSTGQTATFTVTALGTVLTYQWKKDGSNIAGATSPSYTTPVTSIGDNQAVFAVVLSNNQGPITSNPARLTVSASPVAPTIQTQPSNQTVTKGQSASFFVAATGSAPLTYQWQKNGVNIAGATSSTYTTPATVLADSSTEYSVEVGNGAGTASSSTASLKVNSYSQLTYGYGGVYALSDCVKDDVTGLFWEGKTDDETSRDGRSKSYKNYDDNYPSTTPGLDPPNTNFMGYVAQVNTAPGLCGFTDWRRPTTDELLGILNTSIPTGPRIDVAWFVNSIAGWYWTSDQNTNRLFLPGHAMAVNFRNDIATTAPWDRGSLRAVRLVRP